MFAVRFRCIFEVLYLQGLRKKFWVPFHDLCLKTKLFDVKFRRILEVLSWHAGMILCEAIFQKNLDWNNNHVLRIWAKVSCLAKLGGCHSGRPLS